MADTITIYIKGRCGSGKTALAQQIVEMLEKQGLKQGSAKYVRCWSTNGGISNVEEEGCLEFHFTNWR